VSEEGHLEGLADTLGTSEHLCQNMYALAQTPVNLQNLEAELQCIAIPEKEANFIINGFKHGFPICYSGPQRSYMSKNLKSANKNHQVVADKINKEIEEGRVAGPYPAPPLSNFRVSPLGLVPKKGKDEFRLIHHLSYPSCQSVNDFIDPDLCYVKYTQFDEAVKLIQELGQGCLLGKTDIKSAFRLLPVSPSDFNQLGFSFNGQFYFDKCLPFGCSISCATFEKFANILEQAVRCRSPVGNLLHYLDDFLFGGPKHKLDCKLIMNHFQECMDDLGVPIANEKTEGPQTIICFLGLELDSELMLVRMPLTKIIELKEKILQVLEKEKVKLKAMQSLIGALQFACRAIVPGRPFCRRLINATCGLSKPYHHLRVTKAMKHDLEMWLAFFQDFNGVSVFHDRFWTSNAEADLFTDSAAGCGFGIFFAGRWVCERWPDNWVQSGLTQNIMVLEMFPILVSIDLWGQNFRNKRVAFHCDNIAVVHAINTMTSKCDNVMVLLRALTLRCMKYNIMVRAEHIPGKHNIITDSLSRFQMTIFRKHAPFAQREPEPMPSHLWEIFRLEPGSY